MGSVNLDNTGSGSAITLSSDGTSLLLDGTAIGGGGADLYAANESSPSAQPSATGANAIAVGELAVASGGRSIALGRDAVASSGYATAIGAGAAGNGALAAGAGSIAIGDSYASNTEATAIQISTTSSSYGATGANSIAMGSLAKAEDSNAIALNGGRADGSASLAWSTSARARYSRSIALGYNAFSNADNAIALGSNSFSDVKGKIAFSNFTIAPTYSQGSAQSGQYTLGCQTSDATATTMTTDNSASVSSNNQVRLHDHEAVAFDILLVARQDGTDGTACAAWKVVGLINRASGAGTTTLVTSATTVINNTPNWGTPALSADTTNGNLKVQVTGAASTDIAWVATVTTSELTHA